MITVERESAGMMAVEFFMVDSDLLVNELAPRVHNSGHWYGTSTTRQR